MTIEITRNGYGIHIRSSHSKHMLTDLPEAEARELVDKLTAALAPPPTASAWKVVPSSPGMPLSEHDPRRTGVNMLPCPLDEAEHAVTQTLTSGRSDEVRTGLFSLGEAFELAWQHRTHDTAYIVDHGDGTYTVAL